MDDAHTQQSVEVGEGRLESGPDRPSSTRAGINSLGPVQRGRTIGCSTALTVKGESGIADRRAAQTSGRVDHADDHAQEAMRGLVLLRANLPAYPSMKSRNSEEALRTVRR